ncbi:helix-turn-helix domain-containing protein [Pseudonocardia sichuanensis]
MSALDAAIARLVDERVERALAEHQCACSARPTATPQRTAYTVREVGQLLDLTPEQVRHLCLNGDLESFRAGRYIRIPVAALDAFARSQRLAAS